MRFVKNHRSVVTRSRSRSEAIDRGQMIQIYRSRNEQIFSAYFSLSFPLFLLPPFPPHPSAGRIRRTRDEGGGVLRAITLKYSVKNSRFGIRWSEIRGA